MDAELLRKKKQELEEELKKDIDKIKILEEEVEKLTAQMLELAETPVFMGKETLKNLIMQINKDAHGRDKGLRYGVKELTRAFNEEINTGEFSELTKDEVDKRLKFFLNKIIPELEKLKKQKKEKETAIKKIDEVLNK